MPTYEYACPKCGHEFEQFQSMRDEPLKKCPKCKKAGVRRLVGSGAGLIFKGSGFYITDYKNNGHKKAEAAESKSAEPKGTETKATETKASPETKAASPAAAPEKASKSAKK
jgi:putative FmdB family regulatory protein